MFVAFCDVEVAFAFCVAGAIYFRSRSQSACGFFVAGGRRSPLCCCIARKRDTVSKVVAGAAFCECLENWRKLRKNHKFELCKNIAL